jgi:ADP-ribosyl-[dinitrogen reductase] hydrolase
MEHVDRIAGCLIGTAIGDSVGLPAEGLSRQRVARRYAGGWKQRLVLGRGMCSDDTEHALFVAQALLRSRTEPDAFRRSLAWKFRWWLLALPAGCGLATGRAILRLWLGWPSRRSGVRSAGNGAAMRSAVIGVTLHDDDNARTSLVTESTRITHRDPRALTGALAVAEVAAWLCHHHEQLNITDLWKRLRSLAARDDREWSDLLDHLADAWREHHEVMELAAALGANDGVSGYVYQTVPIAIYAALHHREHPRAALESVWRLGGDTDTVGAITGALLGVQHGPDAFPHEWLGKLCDWPRSPQLLRRVAHRLGCERSLWRPVHYAWPFVVPRNIVFFGVVLAHGFMRLGRR